jgi:hypothetical protein
MPKVQYSVSEVKNERNCNASYIFSAVSAFESAFARELNEGTMINFSEQFLLSNLGPSSCLGGSVLDSLTFLIENGTYFEPVYPYFGQSISLSPKAYPNIKLSNFTHHIINNSSDFLSALSKTPLIVKIRYNNESFTSYKSGNYLCSTSYYGTHYMLADGSAFYSNEVISLKNNWGLGWGYSGYLRLNLSSTDPKGPCGLFEEVYSVTFSKNCELRFNT